MTTGPLKNSLIPNFIWAVHQKGNTSNEVDFLRNSPEQAPAPRDFRASITTLLRVTLGADNLHMKVSKSTCCGQSEFYHSFHSNRVSVQIIKEGSMLVIVWYQPELSPRPIVCKGQRQYFRWAAVHLQFTCSKTVTLLSVPNPTTAIWQKLESVYISFIFSGIFSLSCTFVNGIL